jgi:hypothetical protein
MPASSGATVLEAPPFVGQRDRTRRPVEDPDPDALLQPRHRTAHRQLRQSIASPARAKVPASITAESTPIPLSNLLSDPETYFQSFID